MKTKSKSAIKYLGVLTFGLLLATSCTEYLNVAPEVNITETDVFGTFKKYQGFVEDMYQLIVDPTVLSSGSGAECNWNFGLDEGYLTDGRMLSYQFQLGTYTQIFSTAYSPFNGGTGTVGNSIGGRGYWGGGWYGIRKANISLKNIGLLVDGTDEERNIILGQAYFFRAYFHFEILRQWGHIAYIDTVYSASDEIKPPILSYAECARRIDADLRKAVELLPADWETTIVGGVTATKNAGRATKGAAWAYIGLNALYAGSPLMASDATSPNAPDSTKYDTEWCKTAADAYGEVIKLSKGTINGGADGAGGYDLETWQNYHYNFWSNEAIQQLGKEIVFSYANHVTMRWYYGESVLSQMGGWNYLGVTANYVENFGMVNGLPIADANSGFNLKRPWINRDPRFDYSIQKDSDRMVKTPTSSSLQYSYMEFFVGNGSTGKAAWGRNNGAATSYTGFGHKKFHGLEQNGIDGKWGGNYIYSVPIVRLAGILLEYAEAVNEAYGPTGKSPNCSLTAIDAVNMVRKRVKCPPYSSQMYIDPKNNRYWGDWGENGTSLPNVDPKYTASKEIFRQTIRNERTVELCFEGHRFNDARRWGVANSLRYREKYELKFDWAHTYFDKVLILTSAFEPKHWWMPFKTKDAANYPEFKQNPGW